MEDLEDLVDDFVMEHGRYPTQREIEEMQEALDARWESMRDETEGQ